MAGLLEGEGHGDSVTAGPAHALAGEVGGVSPGGFGLLNLLLDRATDVGILVAHDVLASGVELLTGHPEDAVVVDNLNGPLGVAVSVTDFGVKLVQFLLVLRGLLRRSRLYTRSLAGPHHAGGG